ncbi:ABC transporter ATP-binding protein [Arenicella chitinivorans]|uniref:ABC transporter ATP-binding protein n=1 Tax=Arenicella chitinivorans TaxID=1329800 RepID=A0A918VR76_9GAMM|nr:ABC transporter ATP-binding protein [Arenicella chitinivorans]GHA21387.1 ABC transporter ATP-binding protein [Arenicella chitinivorans]
MTAIAVSDLFVSRNGTEVLQGVSFDVEAGSVYALLGGNGAGKSTTLLTLLGFLSPDKGSASVLNSDVTKQTRELRKQIAYLPEAATLYPHLNAYENLAYFLDLAGKKIPHVALDSALDEVGLQPESRKKHMESYSKGMRQKVAIALAILRETPILLLDEPTSGLDPIAIDEFNLLVRTLAERGKTILMVTHDVYGACQVADRIGLLRRGELVGSFDAMNGQKIDTQVVHANFAERANS